jgi:hypothetical protein
MYPNIAVAFRQFASVPVETPHAFPNEIDKPIYQPIEADSLYLRCEGCAYVQRNSFRQARKALPRCRRHLRRPPALGAGLLSAEFGYFNTDCSPIGEQQEIRPLMGTSAPAGKIKDARRASST